MSEDENEKKTRSWSDWLVIAIPIIAVIIILIILLNKKEEVIIDEGESNKIESLVCTSKDNSEGIFLSDSAKKVENKIKVFFDGEKFDKISYSYTGDFETEAVAENARDVFLAEYNIYMGEQGVSASILTPTFSYSEETVLINLAADRSSINATTARFFFLESIEYNNIKNFSKEKVRELYEKKSFICN